MDKELINQKRKIETQKRLSAYFLKNFRFISAAIVMTAMTIAVYKQSSILSIDKQAAKYETIDSQRLILDYQQTIKRLQFSNDSLLKKYLFTDKIRPDGNITSKDFNIINLKLKTLEDNINKQTEITTSLRQAINPLKPEEVLTIVRLKDQIDELNKILKNLDQNLKDRQQNFEDSIKRELSAYNQSTTLILVVLLPLVINFLYTVWKDFREFKIDKSIKTTQSE